LRKKSKGRAGIEISGKNEIDKGRETIRVNVEGDSRVTSKMVRFRQWDLGNPAPLYYIDRNPDVASGKVVNRNPPPENRSMEVVGRPHDRVQRAERVRKPKCKNCYYRGHVLSECWKPLQDKFVFRTALNLDCGRIICFKCNRVGHPERKCPFVPRVAPREFSK